MDFKENIDQTFLNIPRQTLRLNILEKNKLKDTEIVY